MIKVLLVAAHHKTTPGKRSPDGKFREYAYSREIIERVKTELGRLGIDVEVPIPETEEELSLAEQCRILNKIYDECGGNCIIITNHNNASGSGSEWMSARGWEAYTSRDNTKADKLATCLYKAAKECLPSETKLRTDYSDGDPDKEAGFYILKHTKAPCVLTENLFQDNHEDVDFLLSEEGKQTITNLHVQGILKYIVMKKIYSKTDYIEYEKNLPSGTVKDKILALCFENFQDSNNKLRTDVLSLVLGYKMALTNLDGGTLDPDYEACSEILGYNFKSLTYTKIAEILGYDLIDNPRGLTTRGSLASFDLDIVHGELNSDLKYTGEYLSYVYCLERRALVLGSTIWKQEWSQEVKDRAECIKNRVEVFTKYFGSSVELPEFIKPFQQKWDSLDFYSFCYSDSTYGEWEYTWQEYTGRAWYDWTREDQLFYSRYQEAIEQYLELHKNMTLTMSRSELLYYAELSIIQGVAAIWEFENGDIAGDERNTILNNVVERLATVGQSIDHDMSKFAQMSEDLKEEAAYYYDQDKVLEILGWRVYI